MTFRLVVAIAAICFSALPVLAKAPEIFRGYHPLDVPRTDVPVGARWNPGTGPSGATPEGLVISAQGASTFDLKVEDRRKIGLSFAKLVGLSLNSNAIYDVKLQDVTIARVTDVTKLPYRSGQQFILEGIKAKTIGIVLTKGAAAELSAAARAKGYDATLTADGSNSSALTVKGSDLFLAIQVAEFGPAARAETRMTHDGREATVANRFRFQFCHCIGPGKVRLTVTDELDMASDGKLTSTTREVPDGPSDWAELDLGSTFDRGTVSRWSANVRYYREENCTLPDANGQRICFPAHFPKSANAIVVRRSSFPIKPVAKPAGLY